MIKIIPKAEMNEERARTKKKKQRVTSPAGKGADSLVLQSPQKPHTGDSCVSKATFAVGAAPVSSHVAETGSQALVHKQRDLAQQVVNNINEKLGDGFPDMPPLENLPQ